MEQYTDYPVKIPGRLESTAVGGIVADAKDLYDISLNMSQKEINEQLNSLQPQINEIVAATTPLSLSLNKTLVYAGEASTVEVTAVANLDNTEETCDEIELFYEGISKKVKGNTRSVSLTDSITPSVHGTTEYEAVFTIRGINKSVRKNITAHFPVYAGAGATTTLPAKASLTKASVRTSPVGSYTITVPAGGGYIFFMIPDYMNLGTVKSQGFDVPMTQTECSEAGYKAYRNTNDGDLPIDAGTYTFVVS